MQVYQIDTSVSGKGIINLPLMPHLYNKKVKLVIIPTEDNTLEIEQRKRAMERLLKKQETIPATYWTDEELDNIRYECLNEKYQ